jgi:hypothetical protein
MHGRKYQVKQGITTHTSHPVRHTANNKQAKKTGVPVTRKPETKPVNETPGTRVKVTNASKPVTKKTVTVDTKSGFSVTQKQVRIPVRKKPVRVNTGPSASTQERGRTRERKPQMASSYSKFLSHVRHHDFSAEDFSKLGALSDKPNFYFEESAKCKTLTADFLQAFWNSVDNRELTVKNHQKKFNDQGGKEPVSPMCISFINATIKDKDYCFIAISSIDEATPALLSSLKAFIEEHNKQNTSTEFVLLHGKTGNFSSLIQSINQKTDKGAYKTCAEKYFASCLTKLFLQYGNDIRVNGVVNCDLYPFEGDENGQALPYGKQAYALDPTVTPPRTKNGKLVLEDDTIVTTKPCCAACTKNKNAILKIFKAAQSHGAMLLEEPGSVKRDMERLETSPVRRSIATPSSLLTKFSLVCGEKGCKTTPVIKQTESKQVAIQVVN